MIWNVPSKGSFLQFIVPCMSVRECVQENSFLPLIFSRGKRKVILFSFRRASLWGPNQSKFPLCFLLWRDLLLLTARPPVRPSGAVGYGQSCFREHSTCFGIDSTSPPLSSTPVYLAQLSIFPSVYHHSDVQQRQTFLGLLRGKLEAHVGHVQPCPHLPRWAGRWCWPRCSPTPLPGALPAFVPKVQAPSWCLWPKTHPRWCPQSFPHSVLITHPHRPPSPVPSTPHPKVSVFAIK